MKILGIDTSSKFLCLGLYDNGKIYAYNLEVSTKLSALLAMTIKRVLDVLGWRTGDIDYFACGLGPGSFTGTRVGVAAVKAMSWAMNKPLIALSSLDILAVNVSQPQATVIPMIDARRNLIYCSVYKTQNGFLRKISPYWLLTMEEFFKRAKGIKQPYLAGDATGLYKEKILIGLQGAKILDKDYWYPRGHNIIKLALDKIKQKKFNNPFKIKPIYLYPKECQIKKIIT